MAGRTVEEHDEYLNSQPFFGKIEVGDWVHAKLVHRYQIPHMAKPEIVGLCVRVYGGGHLFHIQNPIDEDDVKVVGIENIINVKGAK
jgi:hypothetical protein